MPDVGSPVATAATATDPAGHVDHPETGASATICFRCTSEERMWLEITAEDMRKSVSDLIRDTVFPEASRHLAGKDRAELRRRYEEKLRSKGRGRTRSRI